MHVTTMRPIGGAPALVDPRRAHVQRARHRPRQLRAQRRAALDRPRASPVEQRAAVDGRRLLAHVRRAAPHDGKPRRQVRAPTGTPDRVPRVRRRIRALGDRRLIRAVDRDPGAHGCRCGAHHAGHAVDHHQRVPGQRAAEGDRHLDRDRRRRRRARPHHRRSPAPAVLLGLDLPGEPAHRRDRPRRGSVPHPDSATRGHRDSTRSARSSPSSACARCCTR